MGRRIKFKCADECGPIPYKDSKRSRWDWLPLELLPLAWRFVITSAVTVAVVWILAELFA